MEIVQRVRGRGLRIALWVAGILVVLLVAAQLLLPGLAAHTMRDRVGRYGPVLSAHVSAFPAIELLWGHAGSASLRTGALRMTQSQASELLWSARGVDSLDVAAASVAVEPLRLEAVSVRKRGSAVRLLGTLTLADLRAALPAGVQLQVLSGGGEGGLELSVGGELFGVSASIPVVVAASEGKLVAQPRGISLGGLTQVTLFSDPHLHVESATFTPLAGEGQSWRMDLRATQG
ncbi:MAG TPA: hypothetical protein VID70_10790 [Solirubrobacteraceae bacterium]|jgi:hypothetical protein